MREVTLTYDFSRQDMVNACKQLRPGPGEQLEFYGKIPSGLSEGIRQGPRGETFMGMPWRSKSGCPKLKVRRV